MKKCPHIFTRKSEVAKWKCVLCGKEKDETEGEWHRHNAAVAAKMFRKQDEREQGLQPGAVSTFIVRSPHPRKQVTA